TLMICCLSPASVNYSETLASLRFAARAKAIKAKVTKNVDPAAEKVNALIAENAALRKFMEMLEGVCVSNGLADAVATLPPVPPIA
ncbi:hypothetical protein EON66_06360, partial [archaeon]